MSSAATEDICLRRRFDEHADDAGAIGEIEATLLLVNLATAVLRRP
jgi:hypothetical protein